MKKNYEDQIRTINHHRKTRTDNNSSYSRNDLVFGIQEVFSYGKLDAYRSKFTFLRRMGEFRDIMKDMTEDEKIDT